MIAILVVEDDPSVAEALCESLSLNGFGVTHVGTGRQAIEIAESFDLILLDLGLPDLDGLEVCRRIRHATSVPIIAVTARGDEVDRVLGLTLGADDYVVKPYGNRELLARIEALLRRTRPRETLEGTARSANRSSTVDFVNGAAVPTTRGDLVAPTIDAAPNRAESQLTNQPTLLPRTTKDDPVKIGPLEIDERAHRIWIRGEPIELARKEFAILALLSKEPGILVRREVLISSVWGEPWIGQTRTVDVHVSSLRQKLGVPELIQTVRGVGYRLNDAAL